MESAGNPQKVEELLSDQEYFTDITKGPPDMNTGKSEGNQLEEFGFCCSHPNDLRKKKRELTRQRGLLSIRKQVSGLQERFIFNSAIYIPLST